jgi:hypothetical protein
MSHGDRIRLWNPPYPPPRATPGRTAESSLVSDLRQPHTYAKRVTLGTNWGPD